MSIKNKLRAYYDRLPEEQKMIAQKLYRQLALIPFTKWRKIKKVYTKFGRRQREYIFLSIARFCNINRPMEGYYFEFGCHEANTIRMAYRNLHYLFDWTYVAFDSFQGLPEIEEIDKQKIWKKGKLKTAEDDFIRIVTRAGMPRRKLITIKGFYNESLNSGVKTRLLPAKAAVVYIDCDLYASTVPILNFIRDFLQRGTILVFDDWFCFHGDPQKGERRAFSEFREQNPDLIFEDFVQTNEAKAFIFLGAKQ